MSDDQSDFSNRLRRSKATVSEGAAAPGQARTRKEKKAARKIDKTKRVKSEPVVKAERKAAKSARKAERGKNAELGDALGPAPTAEKSENAKVLRKAEKATRREKRKHMDASIEDAPRGSALVDVPSDEEKARVKAERKAAKAAGKSAKKALPTPSLPAVASSGEEKASAKSERKAAKATMKTSLSDEEWARAKAERKAAKAARKDTKKSAHGGSDGAELTDPQRAEAKAERKARKAEKKAGRKNRRGDDGENDSGRGREIRIALAGFDKRLDARIRAHVESTLAASGAAFRWAETDGKSDLAVYAFEDPSAGAEQIDASINSIAKDKAKFRVFVGRIGSPGPDGSDPFAAENHSIAMLTSTFNGAFIDVASLSRRYGAERVLQNGALTDFGTDLIAAAILGIAAGGRVAKSSLPRPQWPVPPDLAEARALGVAEVISQLSWSNPRTPKLLWTHASKESMEAFLDSRIAFSEEQSLDLNLPIAWPSELPNRAAETQVLGLEFLSGPLDYWYVKANGGTDAEIDAVIKERGVSANEILARAGRIIVDFAGNYPISNSSAWEENAVSRRARVLALFVLCCKMAAKRKVKFDEAVFLRVFAELLNLIEVLRSSDFYEPGSFDGVQQDSLLAGLALTLRNTAYAERLLAESMERLKTLQLSVGLTADGVWRTGTFSDHCTLLAQFKTMLGDFGSGDAALKEPIAAAAKKMTVFAEALLKSDGSPPTFDDSRQKSFVKRLAGTRRALADAGFSKMAPAKGKAMPRITDTYVFREAQYFASHTTQNPVPDSSLVILYREAGSVARDNPGGISLAFAHGAKDLLVGADPEQGTRKSDRAAQFDAALRNGYRINGAGYVPERDFNPNRARLTKSWRGEGWAGAKSIDETNPAGSMIRTVIHLKAQHALIVVDELRAADGSDALFEQFWHIAPGLTPPGSPQTPLLFAAAESGSLTIAFDATDTVSIGPEGEGGTCVRRSFRLGKGVVASLFQWSDAPASAALKILSAADGDWSLEASGKGFHVRLSLAGEDLRYAPNPAL